MTERMKDLIEWTKQVPASYIVARRDNGQPFSTDRSQIDFSPNILIHCQRQRLLLELSYHQYSISLCQPFVSLRTNPDVPTPASSTMAAAALNHSMTLTSMVHQALTSSELLHGASNVFRWQTNALFTMLGYAYTFPICGLSASIRRSIETAITVVDMHRSTQPEAAAVSAIARALNDDIGSIVPGFGFDLDFGIIFLALCGFLAGPSFRSSAGISGSAGFSDGFTDSPSVLPVGSCNSPPASSCPSKAVARAFCLVALEESGFHIHFCSSQLSNSCCTAESLLWN